jgi:hypothetical protein
MLPMPSMRLAFPAFLIVALPAVAQDTYKAEAMKGAPPEGVPVAIRKELADEGIRILNGEGKAFAEVWLRKAIPASAKPSGVKGTIQFPFLAEGELLGAVRFVADGHDYRDQTIAPGVYTLRYGLQPVNGDHLGVSPFRDYGLLLPAAKDADVAPLARKKLETQSAEAAGSSHPAVLMLLAAPSGNKGEPAIVRDETKNTSGAVLRLPLAVNGASGREPLVVQLVIAGMAM